MSEKRRLLEKRPLGRWGAVDTRKSRGVSTPCCRRRRRRRIAEVEGGFLTARRAKQLTKTTVRLTSSSVGFTGSRDVRTEGKTTEFLTPTARLRDYVPVSGVNPG